MDDEGVVSLSGIDVAENFTLPVKTGDRVKIKYSVADDLGANSMSQLVLDEIETMEGEVVKYRNIYYSGPSNWKE